MTGALLDRLAHHIHILEMTGDRYRLATSKKALLSSGQASNTTARTSIEREEDPNQKSPPRA